MIWAKNCKKINVKYRRGSLFTCKDCEYTSRSMSELKTHKTFEHTLSFDVSQNLKGLRQSTRNNSDNTSLMIEDLTAHTSLNKSVTLEEIPIIKCDWLPCTFTSKERATLIKHIDEHIRPKIVPNDGLNDLDHHRRCSTKSIK